MHHKIGQLLLVGLTDRMEHDTGIDEVSEEFVRGQGLLTRSSHIRPAFDTCCVIHKRNDSNTIPEEAKTVTF